MGILFQVMERQNDGGCISILINSFVSSLNLFRIYLLFYETGNISD